MEQFSIFALGTLPAAGEDQHRGVQAGGIGTSPCLGNNEPRRHHERPWQRGETTNQLRTMTAEIQRTSMINGEHQRAVVHARQPSWPELGVKGSRVQISRQPDKRWGVGPRLGPPARVRRPDRRKSARNWRPRRVPAGGRWRSFGSPPVMPDGMTASWGHRLMRRASPRSRRGRVRRSGGAPTPPRGSRASRRGWSPGIRGPRVLARRGQLL
jgi:hypothetical protein